MFKKVLQSISKSLNRQTDATPPPAPAPGRREAPQTGGFASPPPPVAATSKNVPVARSSAPRTPEELLGIEPKMNKEQIRDQLKLLYRRYNRAASSLDGSTRSEADSMLDAIVAVREKHFGEI